MARLFFGRQTNELGRYRRGDSNLQVGLQYGHHPLAEMLLMRLGGATWGDIIGHVIAKRIARGDLPVEPILRKTKFKWEEVEDPK